MISDFHIAFTVRTVGSYLIAVHTPVPARVIHGLAASFRRCFYPLMSLATKSGALLNKRPSTTHLQLYDFATRR